MKRTPVVHPFLFSLFPILALYAYNIRSIPVSPGELAGPLAASLGCRRRPFFRLPRRPQEPGESGASCLLPPPLVFLLRPYRRPGRRLDRGYLQPVALLRHGDLRSALAAFLIVRSRRTFSGLTRLLNIVSVTLVCLQPGLGRANPGPPAARRHRQAVSRSPGRRPPAPISIIIVLDAYTRADVLQEVFAFDNVGFLSALETRGFYRRLEELRELRLHIPFAGVVPEFHLSRHPRQGGRRRLPTTRSRYTG